MHEWPKEQQIVITKEMIVGFNELLKGTAPEGIQLCNTWARTDVGAFCLWNVPSVEALRKFFQKFGPTMLKTTKFYPVLQVYPASVEYELGLLQMIVDAAPK